MSQAGRSALRWGAAPNGIAHTAGMSPKTVLIVDDHDFIREAYALILEQCGYNVLQAANGGDAIRIVRERHPDLVLMDLAMPVVDGLEAAESLKQYPDTAAIPIIGITANSFVTERERMRRICDAFLLKPCSPKELLAEIGRFTEPAAATGS